MISDAFHALSHAQDCTVIKIGGSILCTKPCKNCYKAIKKTLKKSLKTVIVTKYIITPNTEVFFRYF